jgi:hypothetical protein
MLKALAVIILAGVIPIGALAMPKERESIQVQVVSSQRKTHGSPPGEVFHYTDVMFARVNGKNVTYECVQHGNLCPLMDSGKTYAADREGDFIYISMSLPNGNRPISVKYKQLGGW